MALRMKDRYARLDLSKLPKSYQDEFNEMEKSTYGFSDDDLNDIFAENFNDLYSLVESKYPDAIKTGGPVKKTKPAKVKVIKPKKTGLEAAHGMAEKERIKSMRKKLSEEDIEFIEETLRNDEASTDEELIDHFQAEIGISAAAAKKWVALRNRYLKADVKDSMKYSERKNTKRQARKEKDVVKTRDGHEFDRRNPKNKGKTFYDENGKAWKCKGYSSKLDECIFEDEDGKEISGCLKDMYVNNPVDKREKGNLVDECKQTLKDAGYEIKEHKAGKKKIRRSAPRPEKAIIKERVEDAFTPIKKDLVNSDEKKEENKEIVEVLESIQSLFTKFMNRISNLADDGKLEQMKKIEKLLKEIVD